MGSAKPVAAVVGSNSLLGRELRDVLTRTPFQTKLIGADEVEAGTLTEERGEPLIITNLDEENLTAARVVFLAGSAESSVRAMEIVSRLRPRPLVVDLTGALEERPTAHLRAPVVEPAGYVLPRESEQIVAHPAAIVLAMFLVRLGQAGPIRRVIAHVFEPASERGQRGIDELHRQTASLLTFQKLPKAVYDEQAAFNLLARFGAEAPLSLESIETRIEGHLATLLALNGGIQMPSLRLIQAPVFHGHTRFSVGGVRGEPRGQGARAGAGQRAHRRARRRRGSAPCGGHGRAKRHRRGRHRTGPQRCARGVVLGGGGQSPHRGRERSSGGFAAGGGGGEPMSRLALAAALGFALLSGGCGYHVGGRGDTLPKNIKTIAIPAFANATALNHLATRLPADITREFISRTRYQVVADPTAADAVLSGSLLRSFSYASTLDPVTNRASSAVISADIALTLTDRVTGKVIYTRTFSAHERYELSPAADTYFEESDAALGRMSRDLARDAVTSILEKF